MRFLKFKCLLLISSAILFSCKKNVAPQESHIEIPPSVVGSNIIVNGQKFFPVGFYGVNWRDNYEDKIACLDTIAANGFNTVVFDDISTNNFGGILDRAEELGNIKVMVGLGNDDTQTATDIYITNSVNSNKNKSALLGWNIADDADDSRFSIADLNHRNSIVKTNDTNHETYMSLTGYYDTRRQNISQYMGVANIGYQIYPVTPPADYDITPSNALTETYIRTLKYVEAADLAKRVMIMHPQTFKWSDQGRYPTELELRNMCYLGLCAGVDGLIAYDFSFDLYNNHKPLWNEYVSIKNDILVRNIKEYLLEAPLTRYNTNTSNLYASYWKSGNTLLLIVVNTSVSDAKIISINLPVTYSVAAPVVGRMPNTLSLQNANRMAGTIAAEQVEVYKLIQ